MKGRLIVLVGLAIISIAAEQSFALHVTATSTAKLITDGGMYDGWYLYEMDVEWNLDGPGTGLSFWSIILKTGCADEDHLIEFDVPAGYSTSVAYPTDPTALGWTGYFEREGDHEHGITNPIVKYNDPLYPPTDEADSSGYGTFSFYANIIPEYGTYTDALLAKAGTILTYGELTGAYPSCEIVPEPATVALLALGALLLVRRRRT